MTPTTLATALIMPVHQTRWSNDDPDYNIDRNATQRAGRIAAALLALPPDRRAVIAAELLDVELIGRTLETFITGYPAESDRHVEIGTKFLAALLEK